MLAGGAALAAGDDIAARALERKNWWPYATGPRYAAEQGAPSSDPRVICLEAGCFDSRGPGLPIPAELRVAAGDSLQAGAAWLIQIEGPVTEEKKDALRAAGVRLYTYYPNNTFVVRADSPGRLSELPGVLWAGPLHPAYRIEPLLGQAPTADPAKALNESVFVRVLLFEAGEKSAAITKLRALGATIDEGATSDPHDWPDRVYFRASPSAILSAARLDEVRWVEEVSTEGFTLNAESKVVMQSGFVSRGTPYWDAGVNGSTQVVGVVDDGLDVDTILVANTAADAGAPGPTHRKVLAYTSYGGGDLSTCSCNSPYYSHGTNTTQCTVGNRTDFAQNGDLEGVAKKARVVFQDIGSSDAFSCALGALLPPTSLVAAYDEVRAKGGHLSNGSFSICSGYGSHASDADQYMWDHKDYLIHFSAGNGTSLTCPATAKNVVSAGGHYQDPFFNEPYGAAGPAPGGRMAPAVMAPACDHVNGNPAPFNYDTSTSIQDSDCDITGTPATTVRQGMCGTSFSSPYAMGAATLARDYFEKGFHPSGAAKSADAFAPSGALVKAVLLNSGELMTCSTCGSFMSNVQGMGRLNLSRTLALAGEPRTPQGVRVIDKGAAPGVATGGVFEEQIEILDATVPLRVTLNWTDRSGSSLVNNLRLAVVGPSGGASQTFYGGNFTGDHSRSAAAGGTTDDAVNPFESVFVAPGDLTTGVWTVRVTGTNVPQADANYGATQPFALVASGGFSSTGVREVSPPGSTAQLRVASVSGPTITWVWEALPTPGIVYNLYRGDLDPLPSGTYSHRMIDAAHCGLASASASTGDRQDGRSYYYLVSSKKSGVEGGLGAATSGAQRPPANPACP